MKQKVRNQKNGSEKIQTLRLKEARFPSLIITCEHASNAIPPEFQELFPKRLKVLSTHRAYDIGAMEVATALAKELNCPLFQGNYSRLLIDLNRSANHKNLFSELTRPLSDKEKQRILGDYYLPYRQLVETAIKAKVDSGKTVIHLAIHSFTPVLGGIKRTADFGLLYDPQRMLERIVCQTWASELKKAFPNQVVRKNYPYLGVSDGFPSYLRKRFGPLTYVGIELELNQSLFVGRKPTNPKLLSDQILKALQLSLDHQEFFAPIPPGLKS